MHFLFLFSAKSDDLERLRSEVLNQHNLEALVAERNLVYFSSCVSPTLLDSTLVFVTLLIGSEKALRTKMLIYT